MTEADAPDHDSDSQKSYEEILVEQIEEGMGELRRPTVGLCLSGLSAGLDIGFSLLMIGVVITVLGPHVSEGTQIILEANAYAFGFLLVVLGRSELFTEHTARAVFPVLVGRASIRSMLRLWAIVYGSNVVGAILFALLATLITPRFGIVSTEAFGSIAKHLVHYDWWLVALSAVLAGWLMGMLSWLLSAAQETISRAFVVWLITAGIGLLGLHHCIVGTAELAAGVIVGAVGIGESLSTLFWATVGNAVGGVVFVAIVKYGHASRGA